MSVIEEPSYDARITVHDLYLIILWDTNYFQKRPNDKRICGRRVCEGLFSVEAFASNSKPEHRIAQALADAIRPELMNSIKTVEDTLKNSLIAINSELEDPLVTAVEIAVPEAQEFIIAIEKGKGTPLVNSFIRLFVLTDHITTGLKELFYRGVITKKDQKKREDQLTKPLRKLMNDLNIIIKKYHQQRKEIAAAE